MWPTAYSETPRIPDLSLRVPLRFYIRISICRALAHAVTTIMRCLSALRVRCIWLWFPVIFNTYHEYIGLAIINWRLNLHSLFKNIQKII